MWELYLFAVLSEANVVVARPHPAPDFLARGLTGEFTLEATTINPSIGSDGQRVAPPEPKTAEEVKAYFQYYLPIRYAGPLTAKLRKEYWTHPLRRGSHWCSPSRTSTPPCRWSTAEPRSPLTSTDTSTMLNAMGKGA